MKLLYLCTAFLHDVTSCLTLIPLLLSCFWLGFCLSTNQAARKLAITEVDLERAEARLEAAEA